MDIRLLVNSEEAVSEPDLNAVLAEYPGYNQRQIPAPDLPFPYFKSPVSITNHILQFDNTPPIQDLKPAIPPPQPSSAAAAATADAGQIVMMANGHFKYLPPPDSVLQHTANNNTNSQKGRTRLKIPLIASSATDGKQIGPDQIAPEAQPRPRYKRSLAAMLNKRRKSDYYSGPPVDDSTLTASSSVHACAAVNGVLHANLAPVQVPPVTIATPYHNHHHHDQQNQHYQHYQPQQQNLNRNQSLAIAAMVSPQSPSSSSSSSSSSAPPHPSLHPPPPPTFTYNNSTKNITDQSVSASFSPANITPSSSQSGGGTAQLDFIATILEIADFNEALNTGHQLATLPTKTSRKRSSASAASDGVDNQEKPFLCSICSNRFLTKGHLKRHTRSHTGEKPYECLMANCNKRFTRHDNMIQHYRTHFSLPLV